jgi:hypothetical protein
MDMTEEPRSAPWDFALMMATVGLLAALGAQSVVGTAYVWWVQRGTPDWSSGPGYAAYVDLMNAIAAPLLVALIVAIGLCVPKRVFARRTLVAVSACMVALGATMGLVAHSVVAGLTAYLLAAAVLQVVVAIMTLVASGGLTYLTEGHGRKLGSALLHLGFIVFALVVVALQDSPLMLPVFFASALLLVGGSALSFYARG